MDYTIFFSFAVLLVVKLADGQDATPNPLCPYPSDDFTRFPYEGNCSKYWECYQGQRYALDCPGTMHFNPEKSVCDFPNEANCDPDSTVTYPTFTPGPTTTTTPGTGPTQWTPDPLCPYPSEELTYLAYPTNCSLYYECFQGRKYLLSCPPELVFNLEKKYCDYPDNVDCSRTSTTSPEGSSTEPITPAITTSTVPSDVTTPPPESTSAPPESTSAPPASTSAPPESTSAPPESTSAPPESTSAPPTTLGTTTSAPTGKPTPLPNICTGRPDGTVIADEDDCSKYYECIYGEAITSQCPDGLLYSPDKKRCDHAENVTCAVNVCADEPDGTFLPNMQDCSKYYECIYHETITSQCPEGLLYNQEKKGCDLAANVQCAGANVCSDEPDGTYLPDPQDCNKYYECIFGQTITSQCPASLLWNRYVFTCDYPEHVKCN
ncbi:hypothetical protein NQ315_001151 [Exocentrus adspersus]|uniref:Chitin-binding type-2 domain-containing protein n=1 Tax=Exocentrus adspersus TaxID=1586481 RepID=A0AAV8WGW9_9CUCU|nr:hypothetical protein NQ315_001151 [Exocentrus adspersus]